MVALQDLVRGLEAGGSVTVKTALVLGGGFVGASCAWNLQRAGFATSLVDPGDPRRAASFGNAGHLASEQTEPLASWETLRTLPQRLFLAGGPVGLRLRHVATWLPFGMRLIASSTPARFAAGSKALKSLAVASLPAWQRLVQGLQAPALIREEGHFAAWESEATFRSGLKELLASDMGYAKAREATGDELAVLRARFANRPVGAARYSGTGQVADIPALRARLDESFRMAGGVRVAGEVPTVDVAGGRPRAILSDGRCLEADIVVVACGVGSAGVLRALHGPIPLIAERGYHIDTRASDADWPHDLPPVAFPDRSTIVTRFESSLRMTSFTEFARADAAPDPRKFARLERHADELGLPKGEGRTRWMGPRPTLPDFLPAIGRARAAPGLLYAFGHQHLGVTLSAITGELIAALARDETPAIPLAPFDLERF
jgi:D-hydroxyproline dehydrogenase